MFSPVSSFPLVRLSPYTSSTVLLPSEFVSRRVGVVVSRHVVSVLFHEGFRRESACRVSERGVFREREVSVSDDQSQKHSDFHLRRGAFSLLNPFSIPEESECREKFQSQVSNRAPKFFNCSQLRKGSLWHPWHRGAPPGDAPQRNTDR